MITQEELKELLHYDPNTGLFTWKVVRSNRYKVGNVAGFSRSGYVDIGINNRGYRAHRLAFLYMTGLIPKEVDHINRIRHDNRWENLRGCTSRENSENTSCNNEFIGVRWHRDSCQWVAYATKVNGRQKYLGAFRTHLAACNRRWAHELSTGI